MRRLSPERWILEFIYPRRTAYGILEICHVMVGLMWVFHRSIVAALESVGMLK